MTNIIFSCQDNYLKMTPFRKAPGMLFLFPEPGDFRRCRQRDHPTENHPILNQVSYVKIIHPDCDRGAADRRRDLSRIRPAEDND